MVDALAVTPAPVRCVFGMRGFGKTTLARELVAAEPRVLAYDPLDEHGCLALEWEAFKAYVEANLPRPRFRLALVDDAEWSEDFCAIARVLAERQPGYTLLLEEADLVAEPGHEPPVFKWLMRRGRHFGVAVVACTRRPAELSRNVTAFASDMYVFRTQEPRDLVYLTGYLGRDAAAVVEELPLPVITSSTLTVQYVHWTLRGWRVETLVKRISGGAGTASSSEGPKDSLEPGSEKNRE